MTYRFDNMVCWELPLDQVKRMVQLLMDRDDLSNGSSFAVTGESYKKDFRTIYLSKTSREYLQKHWNAITMEYPESGNPNAGSPVLTQVDGVLNRMREQREAVRDNLKDVD